MIVQRMLLEEWQRVRAIRLRALRETPDAFGSTLNDALALPAEVWRHRLTASDAATFVAAIGDDDIGLAVGAPYDDATGLFAMWVAPEARGKGVGNALVHAVVHWAKQLGAERLLLDVGDWNKAAIALYQRNGFEPTGRIGTVSPQRSHITEHQRVLRLR